MDKFNKEDLEQLASASAQPAVSLLMPTIRAGREVRQNSIRFGNLYKRVEQEIEQFSDDEDLKKSLTRQIADLEDNDPWWQHQSDGLALYFTTEKCWKYRVPIDLEEIVTIGQEFHVRPLIKLAQNDGSYYVLAVSQKQVRLLVGTQTTLDEVDVEYLPSDLRSALNIDEYVSALQFQSTSRASRGEAVHHGHGGSGMEVQKSDELLQFFHRIDTALSAYLAGAQEPLVFAGVDYLFSIFRQACSYKNLVDAPAKGNPDDLRAEQLHPKVMELITPLFEEKRQESLDRYHREVGNQRTADSIEDIIKASRQGAVETLLLAQGKECWGTYDDQNNVKVCPEADEGAVELLNDATVKTLTADGTVYSLQPELLPEQRDAVAILRYPLA